jgi:UDP-N-acetylglucosamine:LPS N-acetylglucosamine transferase
MKRVLFVSSSGGHWIQLRRLESALGDYEKYYISTDKHQASVVNNGTYYYIQDASRWNKGMLLWQALRMLFLILRIRPDAIISTGAAPGFFAMLWGKLTGSKTIWVDSIANVDEMSLSGKKVKKYADLWLTQWSHLESDDGPKYFGKII